MLRKFRVIRCAPQSGGSRECLSHPLFPLATVEQAPHPLLERGGAVERPWHCCGRAERLGIRGRTPRRHGGGDGSHRRRGRHPGSPRDQLGGDHVDAVLRRGRRRDGGHLPPRRAHRGHGDLVGGRGLGRVGGGCGAAAPAGCRWAVEHHAVGASGDGGRDDRHGAVARVPLHGGAEGPGHRRRVPEAFGERHPREPDLRGHAEGHRRRGRVARPWRTVGGSESPGGRPRGQDCGGRDHLRRVGRRGRRHHLHGDAGQGRGGRLHRDAFVRRRDGDRGHRLHREHGRDRLHRQRGRDADVHGGDDRGRRGGGRRDLPGAAARVGDLGDGHGDVQGHWHDPQRRRDAASAHDPFGGDHVAAVVRRGRRRHGGDLPPRREHRRHGDLVGGRVLGRVGRGCGAAAAARCRRAVEPEARESGDGRCDQRHGALAGVPLRGTAEGPGHGRRLPDADWRTAPSCT